MQRHDFAYDLPPELIAQTPLATRSASRLLVLEPDCGVAGESAADSTSAAATASRGDTASGEAGDLAAAVITSAGAAPGFGCTSAAATQPSSDGGTHLTAAGGGDIALAKPNNPAAAASDPIVSAAPMKLRDCAMRDFPTLLRSGDLLVFNDTKVVAARLVGTKPSGGRVEIFLERVVAEAENEALVQLRASKPIREGLEVTTVGGVVRILGRQDDLWRVGFPGSALEFFEKWGDVPLPPYIHRAPDANDRERYQSIFARERGAVAAPTASLHFDSELIRRIEEMGVSRAFVTLHVGAGTFQPVRMDDLDGHVMHAERVSVSAATCRAIEMTRAAGGRVIAIGTTVMRALESAALAGSQLTHAAAALPATGHATAPLASDATATKAVPPGSVTSDARATKAVPPGSVTSDGTTTAGAAAPQTGRAKGTAPATGPLPVLPQAGWSGETRLFIRPGFNFQVADALLTNFHLPASTLLMLVCAFAGMSAVLKAYEHAVHEKYRFFSYGDAMFLTRARTNATAPTAAAKAAPTPAPDSKRTPG